MSRFAAHAARRNRRKQLRERAPRISPTIEAAYVAAVTRAVRAFQSEIRRGVEPQLRHDAAWQSFKDKAAAIARGFRSTAFQIAKRMEKFSKSEAVRTLGDIASDMSDSVVGFAEEFAADAVVKLRSLLEDSVDATEEAVAGEEVGAAFSLTDLLSGWLSRSINSARNQVTQGTAELNQERSESAGITDYVWISEHDDRTRPAHAALDGQECAYADPPLSAVESSSGEACNPGDDYGCRCMASPIISIEAEPASADEEEAA